MRGNCGFWFLFLVWGWGVFWLFFVLLVFFSPSSRRVSSPSMMTWALRPHGVRTCGKKRRESRRGVVVVPKKVLLQLWVTRVLPSIMQAP